MLWFARQLYDLTILHRMITAEVKKSILSFFLENLAFEIAILNYISLSFFLVPLSI